MKQFVNDFTKECDKYLSYKNEYIFTYIMEYDKTTEEEIMVFRTPGGTRGCIYLTHNQIIKDIVFYDDSLENRVYSNDVVEKTKRFIGEHMNFYLVPSECL